MNNNMNYVRVYDEKLDLLVEVSENASKSRSTKLKELLKRSQLFLSVDNLACYRVIPKLH